jgi:ABC-2 type transport system permease protein
VSVRKAIAVGRKEFRQIARDRRTLLILLFMPLFFLLLFGYALNFDTSHISLAVADRDQTTASRQLVSSFVNSGYFDLTAVVTGEAEYGRLVDRGEVRTVLVIPAGLQRDLLTGRRVPVQVIINGDNANTAATVMGYSLQILQTASAQYTLQPRSGSGAPLVSIEPRVWYNPQLKSALFFVPGLIAYIGMLSAVISTSLSVVREKERGTMEQVRMAPIDTFSYIVGKTIPYFGISMCSSLLIVLASMVLFDVPMHGSWLLLILALSLYLLGALGLGLMVSSIADSQQVAFQVAVLSSFLPTMILSGFVFPIASMPEPIRVFTYVVPARYFLVALRAILLKGAGLSAYWQSLAALAVFDVVMLTIAARRLKGQWT